MSKHIQTKTWLVASILVLGNFALAGTASAHCDGLDGPVISEARSALDKKEVTPLLKWVPASSERSVKTAFAQTLAERAKGKAAQEAADRKFFETLVRIHRESEGAPFTGIKPAGQIAPVVMEADAALAQRNVDQLAKHVAARVEESIRDKFEKAAHSKESADVSVEKGREFVSNYVQYVHFVEEISNVADAPSGHHEVASKQSGLHHEH